MERIIKLIKNNRQFIIGLALILCCHYGPSTTKAIFRRSTDSYATVNTADWNVNMTGTSDNAVSIVSREKRNDTYTFKVSSNSEVDVTYKLILTNVPDKVQVKLDDREFVGGTGGTITIDPAGTILYSDTDKEVEHTLTFKALSGATAVTDLEIGLEVVISQVLN
jgi:hypothetical protein